MASETVIHPAYKAADSSRELRLQDRWVVQERDWRKTLDNPITWDLDTQGLLPLGLSKGQWEQDFDGWNISFLELGHPAGNSSLHIIVMFGPTSVPSPDYPTVQVQVELEFQKAGGEPGKLLKLELTHPASDMFSNNGFFSRLILRHSPVFEDYKQDAFLSEFLTDGHITLQAGIKICMGTQPREYLPAGRRRFVEDIATILDTGLDSDFSLICEDREFPCHRAILRARSEVFAKTFSHRMQENEESRFVIHDSSPVAVEALLNHLYTGAIPADLDNLTVEILQLAEFFQLGELREECRLSLLRNLGVENAVTTLVHVDCYFHQDGTGMKDKVKEFIRRNAAQVVDNEHWGKFVRSYPDMVTEVFRAVIESQK